MNSRAIFAAAIVAAMAASPAAFATPMSKPAGAAAHPVAPKAATTKLARPLPGSVGAPGFNTGATGGIGSGCSAIPKPATCH